MTPQPDRYLIYRWTGSLELVATTATKEGVGTTIVTLGEEGEFEGCLVGVLDKPIPDKPGRWLVSPWMANQDAPSGGPGDTVFVNSKGDEMARLHVLAGGITVIPRSRDKAKRRKKPKKKP